MADSKKQKRGVALFGPPGYDVFGVVPAYGTTSWAPTGFGSVPWNPPTSPDIALAQIQAQATHNVALQVRISYSIQKEKESCNLYKKRMYVLFEKIIIFYVDSEGSITWNTKHCLSTGSHESDSAG